MVQRRELVGGGLAAGLATLMTSSAEAAPAFDDEQTAGAIHRLRESRYAMAFMFTTLLLRPDQAPDFVGYPFDTDSQGRAR